MQKYVQADVIFLNLSRGAYLKLQEMFFYKIKLLSTHQNFYHQSQISMSCCRSLSDFCDISKAGF